jgi:hypothetical protein
MAETMVSIPGETLHSISFGRLAYCALRYLVTPTNNLGYCAHRLSYRNYSLRSRD